MAGIWTRYLMDLSYFESFLHDPFPYGVVSRAVDHVIFTATALASPAGIISSIYAVPTTNSFERGGISLKKKKKKKKTKSGI